MSKEIIKDKNLVAFCGLYCGACKRYLAEKCPGCRENEKASWCGIRKCCLENNYSNCSACQKFQDTNDCKDFNNFFSKLFGFIFRSNREACIDRIKEIGEDEFAREMTEKKTHSIKR
jgi:hypothetical protein